MNAKIGHSEASIDYPCRWRYKVIGSDEAGMRAAIAAVTADAADVTAARSSATGKYLSLDVAVDVADESARLAIYTALCKDPSIKMVL
jgi:putative lipoic acid-binding regulatory protein